MFVESDVEDSFITGSADAGMPSSYNECRGLRKHHSRASQVSEIEEVVYTMSGDLWCLQYWCAMGNSLQWQLVPGSGKLVCVGWCTC